MKKKKQPKGLEGLDTWGKYKYWRRMAFVLLQRVGAKERKKYIGKTPKQIDEMFFKEQRGKYVWWRRNKKIKFPYSFFYKAGIRRIK